MEPEKTGLQGTGDRVRLGKTGNNEKTDKCRTNGLKRRLTEQRL